MTLMSPSDKNKKLNIVASSVRRTNLMKKRKMYMRAQDARPHLKIRNATPFGTADHQPIYTLHLDKLHKFGILLSHSLIVSSLMRCSPSCVRLHPATEPRYRSRAIAFFCV